MYKIEDSLNGMLLLRSGCSGAVGQVAFVADQSRTAIVASFLMRHQQDWGSPSSFSTALSVSIVLRLWACGAGGVPGGHGSVSRVGGDARGVRAAPPGRAKQLHGDRWEADQHEADGSPSVLRHQRLLCCATTTQVRGR